MQTHFFKKHFVHVVELLRSRDWFSKHITVAQKQVHGEEFCKCIHSYWNELQQLAFKLESSEHFISRDWLWTQFTTLDCSELTNESSFSLRFFLCNLLFLERFLHGWFSILQLDPFFVNVILVQLLEIWLLIHVQHLTWEFFWIQ